MMLVETLDTHGRVQSRQRFHNVGAVCTIGRGLACDVVLDDAYAAAEHTSLRLLEDGRVAVQDLGSRNGTRLSGQRLGADTTITIEDGLLIIGRSHVRIRTALTALAPEVLFRRDTLQRYQTPLSILGVVLGVGYAVFDQWLKAPDNMAPRLLTAVLTAVAIIALWTAVWALITRVVHGVWNLRTHVAIGANAAAFGVWVIWLMSVASFATQWRWLTTFALILVVIAALGALYLHLRKATYITRRMAATIATAIPLTFGGIAAWISQQDEVRNVNRIVMGAEVHPPYLRITPSADINDYLTSINALRREASRKRQQSLVETPIAEPDTP